MSNFALSNKYGRSGEKYTLQLLQKNGFNAIFNTDKNTQSYYDIIITISPRKKIFIENKFDMMHQITGNLAIEFHNPASNKPSGLNITKADIWSYMLMDEGNPTIWFANVPKLKNFIQTVKPFKTIQKGGDGNASLYLYSASVILPAVFHQMNNLADTESFQKIVKTLSTKNKE